MDERRARPRWGIRGRITGLAALLVGLALLIGIGVFANVLYRVLVTQLQASVVSEAGIVARAVADRGPASVHGTDVTAAFDVQLLDPYGNVIYTTSDSTPLSTLQPMADEVLAVGADGWWIPFDDAQQPIVAAQGVVFDGVRWTVLVATVLEPPHETVSITAGVLLLSLPIVLALVAGVAWWVVGRALRPVEDIRTRVETIGATSLADRVPVPDSADEIAALATTMNGMLTRLEAARDAQLRFVADASHELRSPLTALSGALELVEDDAATSTGTVAELLPLLRSETARLQGLVGGMLYLARADARRAPARVEVDVDDLVLAEASRLRSTAAVAVHADVAPVRIVGDPDALTQVLRNLCDNAVRHAVGSVVLSTRPEDRFAVVSVEDDGGGVPAPDRRRIFERFVRLDDSRSRDAGGSGLGLAIVTEIVGAHGGTVTVDDSPVLGGARFTVRLPVPQP